MFFHACGTPFIHFAVDDSYDYCYWEEANENSNSWIKIYLGFEITDQISFSAINIESETCRTGIIHPSHLLFLKVMISSWEVNFYF